MDKRELRKRLINKRNNISIKYKTESDNKICEHLVNSKVFKKAEIILCYKSTKVEVSTEKIIENALENGKKVYVPKIKNAKIGEMDFLCIDKKAIFVVNKFGIFEPTYGELFNGINKDSPVLSITPCVGANKKGGRTGYGGGFYDRFFDKTICIKLVLCYEKMISEDIIMEEKDVVMDYFVSEKGIISCKS